MKIIDVTLRDGGHAVKFDWPIGFAQEFYHTLSQIKRIDFIELGYWKQNAKTSNFFYNLDYEKVLKVTQGAGNKNVAIMIDYHYCSHKVEDYPTASQNEIAIIRLCSRKEDLEDAMQFGKALKEYTQLAVSLNVFNTSNYGQEELLNVCQKASQFPFDFIYFADTHGSIDFKTDFSKFASAINHVKAKNKNIGFHLHDHSGKAYFNYQKLIENEIGGTDTSIRGMGKGSGNLKLEHVLEGDDLILVAELIRKHTDLLTMQPSPYHLITAKHSVSDNYGEQALEMNLNIEQFDAFCATIQGTEKDSFNNDLMKIFIDG